MMEAVSVQREIGGKTLKLETGKIAKQAAGAVMVTYGETVVLATVVTGAAREGIDFFPLTVDYREKISAAGKFPGGFFKREGRPTTKEILTMRVTDRPIRPLFPEEFRDEVLIQSMVLAADKETEPDIMSMIGSSAALSIAPLPFEGPIGAVRIARVEDEFVINPTQEQMEYSTMDMLVAGTKDAVNMIEVGCRETTEDIIAAGFELAQTVIVDVCEMIEELKEKAGKPHNWEPPAGRSELKEKIRARALEPLRQAKNTQGKQDRYKAVKDVYDEVISEFLPEDADPKELGYDRNFLRDCIDKVEGEVMTDMVLAGTRSDGRGPKDIRPITCEVGILPRVHGSALFTRGETQTLVTTTLGTSRDEQVVDGLFEEYSKKFMLHYNFPPFCTGEVRRIGAVSRREIGHGALAEKALEAVLPSPDVFPYTVRLVSDIMESNGSSSMASVCGGTLALMDAGVRISQPVAGISVGMFSKGDQYTLVTDILGEEDHFGDMDFKVAGTQRGITGIQVDLKARGLTQQQIVESLEQAREARLDILRSMLSSLSRPRADISPFAPRIITIQINPEKIGRVIGPGGKEIRNIEAISGATIEIEEDGTIRICTSDGEAAEIAKARIELLTDEVKVGRIYEGRVSSVKDFGAFVELAPGQDGLCHISELSNEFVKSVSDVCKVGDILRVKVIAVDEQGRVKLSRKVLQEEEAEVGE
jgi:polyribonucleotide nucleotidyltransferase